MFLFPVGSLVDDLKIRTAIWFSSDDNFFFNHLFEWDLPFFCGSGEWFWCFFFFSRLVLLLLVVLVVSVVVSMLNHSELYPFYACGTRCCFVCFFTQLDSEWDWLLNFQPFIFRPRNNHGYSSFPCPIKLLTSSERSSIEVLSGTQFILLFE